METDQGKLAARFLLGKLNDDEQSDIEQEFFRNADCFENILIAENSLTDAYVSKRLSPDDRQLFEQRLLISPRQRQKAAFAEDLQKYAAQIAVDDVALSNPRSQFSTIVGRFFSEQTMFSYSLTAAVFLVLLGAVFLWTSTGLRRSVGDDLAKTESPVEIESQKPVLDGQIQELGPIAESNKSSSSLNIAPNKEQTPKSVPDQSLPKKHLASRHKAEPIISTLILPFGTTRDSQTAKTFLIPNKATLLDFQLNFEEGNFSSYFVVLETADGQQVWKGKVFGSRKNNDKKTVTLTIPSKRVGRGDYVMSLKGLTNKGVFELVAEYSFTVDR